MSLLMAAEAASIFSYSAESPMILAALRTSRHISSSRTMVRTMDPSCTSVSLTTVRKLGPLCPQVHHLVSPNLSAASTYSSGATGNPAAACTSPAANASSARALARLRQRPRQLRR